MAKHQPNNFVRIRPWPKVIFFYPSVVLAGIVALLSLLNLIDTAEANRNWNLIFMLVFSINVLIFAFDFSILMTIIIGITVVLGGVILWLLNAWQAIFAFFASFDLGMNSSFSYYYFLFFVIVFAVVWVRTRFNYWDVRHNELFHRHGLLGDTERINAPNLSYTREIGDVFELALAMSGRIKLIPQNREPYVIDNVLSIWEKDRRLAEILSKLKVTVDQAGVPDGGGGQQ